MFGSSLKIICISIIIYIYLNFPNITTKYKTSNFAFIAKKPDSIYHMMIPIPTKKLKIFLHRISIRNNTIGILYGEIAISKSWITGLQLILRRATPLVQVLQLK